jgi:hypothetical protein
MDVRHCYAAGISLALVGSLVVVAGMVLAGSAATGGIALGAVVALVFALRNVSRREDFDRDHSLGYRLANWGGALFSLALGLFALAVGVLSFDFFA